MPGYQTVSQSGAWRPGGAGRLYVNPQQRPGIREEQIAVGRQALGPIQIRHATSLDNQGVGIVPALIAAGATVLATGASIALQKKTEKKQKAAMKKAKKQAALLEKQEQEAAQALVASPVSAGVAMPVAGRNWMPLVVGGGAVLIALFLFTGGKR